MTLNKAIIATLGLSMTGMAASAQNPPTQPPPAQSSSSAPASEGQKPTAKPAQPQSLGDAARKAREQHKDAPQATKSFTNDNVGLIPDRGVSTVGQAPAPPTAAPKAEAAPAEPKKDEKYWRKKFADVRERLALAEKEVDVLQRELNLAQTQYYSDPNQALKQQYSRDDINEKAKAIEAKKLEVTQLQRALADLQDELRHAGGEPGWGN